MRAALLSLLRVTVAVAVLALAGAALVTQPVLGSIAPPRERSVPATLRTHVTQLTTTFSPRGADYPQNLDAAADYIRRHFTSAGARTELQTYQARKRTYQNALLELARLLGKSDVQTPVMLVAYSNEEPPFFGSDQMGSAVHAQALGARPVAGAGMRAWSFTGPRETLDASDHRNYWAAGHPAVVVTDTAFLRNPNYHTRNDTAATLDYQRMARVVDGVFSAITHPSHLKEAI